VAPAQGEERGVRDRKANNPGKIAYVVDARGGPQILSLSVNIGEVACTKNSIYRRCGTSSQGILREDLGTRKKRE